MSSNSGSIWGNNGGSSFGFGGSGGSGFSFGGSSGGSGFGGGGSSSGFGGGSGSGFGGKSAFSSGSSGTQKGRVEISIPNSVAGDAISDISAIGKGDIQSVAVSTWRNQLYVFRRGKAQAGQKSDFSAIVTIDDPYPDFLGVSRCALGDNTLFFATVSGRIKCTDGLSETVKESDIGTHSHLITGLKLLSASHIASCSLDGYVRVWDVRTGGATPKVCVSHECGKGERCVALDAVQSSLFVATDNLKVYKYDLRNPSNPSDIMRTTNMAISEKTKSQGKMISCLAVRKVPGPCRMIAGTTGGCVEIFKEGNSMKETQFWPNQNQTQTGEPVTAVAMHDKWAILGAKEKATGGSMSGAARYKVSIFDTANAVKAVKTDPKPHEFGSPITALEFNAAGNGYFVATGCDLTQLQPGSDKPRLFYVTKIVLVGDSGTGKSSLISRYTENTFSEDFSSTIGIDYALKHVTLNDTVVKMQIWDTAGQEKFLSITSQYFRNSDGIVLVYDVTNRTSFSNIQFWIKEAQISCDPNTLMFIVGNKIDCEPRMVSFEEAEDMAKSLGFKYFETSSKTGKNVNEVFLDIGKLVMESRTIRNDDNPPALIENKSEHSNGYCWYC